jgi:hypothetical protein
MRLNKQTEKMKPNQLGFVAILLMISSIAFAQENSLLDGLEEPSIPQAIIAAFKTSRVINGHSLENVAAGVLDVKISHRFGRLNSGAYNAWGLDNAYIRIGIDYGMSRRLMVGLGRSSFEKTFDGFLKYKLLQQKQQSTPISMVWFSSVAYMSENFAQAGVFDPAHRLSYTHQLILGRKFSERFSLQIMPTWVYRNLVVENRDQNSLAAMGIAFRQKITRRTAFNFEYYHSPQLSHKYKNSLSFGVDIETGGHVFQLHLSNSRSMIEKGFIGETTGNWAMGDIHFGFNIARVFTAVSPQKLKN